MPVETSQTLARGLRVLEVLAAAPAGMTGAEVARTLDLNRTALYRLVRTLEQHGLLRRAPDGRLLVGLGVLGLAAGVQPVLREAALPVLRSLAESAGATAHLTLAEGGEALAVAVVEPTWTDFHVGYRVGVRHPLTRGAAGRAILRWRDEGARSPAYVVTQGELQAGARGLAAAVRGAPGLEASVGVVTLGALDVDRVGALVEAAAAQLAASLTGSGSEPGEPRAQRAASRGSTR